ncbi:MAG: hypothetical protein JJU15_03375 [Pararhodobacter sp.]|nr:hypothetical protein [Pararhodobacter sp.]
MSADIYKLEILKTEIKMEEDGPHVLVVRYHGKRDPQEVHQPLESADLDGILKGCEAVARKIFHDEFRLNQAVDLSFTLETENGIKIWHTQPNLFVKCPLKMSMNWSCHHLSNMYKTMTTLGMIELPDEMPLEGNALGAQESAKVIMESMASGVEFMGHVVMMRDTVDHNAMASMH